MGICGEQAISPRMNEPKFLLNTKD